jgi:hypothetical protein
VKTAATVLVVAIMLGILAGLVYGLFWAGGYGWARLAELDGGTRTVLLTAVASVLLASLIVAGALRVAGRTVGRTRLLREKLALYQEILGHYRDGLAEGGASDPDPLPDDLEAELLLLGTPGVLVARANLVDTWRNPDASPHERMRSLAALTKAMRRDLGHPESIEEFRLDHFASDEPEADYNRETLRTSDRGR